MIKIKMIFSSLNSMILPDALFLIAAFVSFHEQKNRAADNDMSGIAS